MPVDISAIVQAIVGLAATAIGIIGTAALYRLEQRLGLQVTAAQQSAFDSCLNKCLVYGATRVTDMIAAKGWEHPEVHSAIVAEALTQAATVFPDALRGVGLTPNLSNPGNAATLTAALQRALPAAIAEASASPATPPVRTAPAPVPAPVQTPAPAST